MSKKGFNKGLLLALAVAVLLPLSFYIITAVMSKGKLFLPPHYVADSVITQPDGSTDTIWHRVADVTLTNQFGKQVSLNKDFKGKILVVNFIFTTCPTFCPQLTNNMWQLQKAFHKDKWKQKAVDTSMQFISITVNPEVDSFPVLRRYADSYNVGHDNWSFLTGSREDIYNYARNELFVNMQEGTGGLDDLLHTDKFVLIDTMRQIRGYYKGTDTAEVIQCADDLVILTKEKIRKK